MYLFSPDGVLLEANERYYEMTGHDRYDESPFAFLNAMDDDSRKRAGELWPQLMVDPKMRQQELRFTKSNFVPRDLSGDPIDFWVLATSQPEIGSDGKVRYVTFNDASRKRLPRSFLETTKWLNVDIKQRHSS
jgi:PAS domain-containing protein